MPRKKKSSKRKTREKKERTERNSNLQKSYKSLNYSIFGVQKNLEKAMNETQKSLARAKASW
jgi:hypothetical protein